MPMVSCGMFVDSEFRAGLSFGASIQTIKLTLGDKFSAATNSQNGEGVAIKKVTNVFSKKILAKRALRELKLLQHFRGMFDSLSTSDDVRSLAVLIQSARRLTMW